MRQHLWIWSAVLALWALLVLMVSGQMVFTADLAWDTALQLAVRYWLPWAILSPAVVWLATRFPFDHERLSVSIPVHLLACVGALLFCNWAAPTSLAERMPQPGWQQAPADDVPPPGPGPRREGPRRPMLQRQRQAPFPGTNPPPADQLNSPPQSGEWLREQRRRMGAPRRPILEALVTRASFNVPVYWALVSIVNALRYYRSAEERGRRAALLEARLADAKLQALRMQLHPHFLFNTLNAISTLVHKDPDAADEMIVNLSELLRVALDTTEQEITLRREFDFLDRYLEIQQVRYGDRLRVEKEIDASALDGLVPTFILQPLVENALRHGIEPEASAGVIALSARREGPDLRLTVRNTGVPGRQPGREQQGIGIANTRGRLQALYGDRARLTLSSSSDGGFSAELLIPFHDRLTPAPPPTRA